MALHSVKKHFIKKHLCPPFLPSTVILDFTGQINFCLSITPDNPENFVSKQDLFFINERTGKTPAEFAQGNRRNLSGLDRRLLKG